MVIKNVIKDVKNTRGKVFFTFIDFTNAYGSLDHECLFETMKKMKIPGKMRRVIEDKYREGSFRVVTPVGTSEKVMQTRGVKQGDPQSPLEYIISEEPVLREIENSCDGYKWRGESRKKIPRIKVAAFVDDLVLISDSKRDMVRMVKVIEKFCKWSGIRVNHDKSGVMALNYKLKGNVLRNLTFQIDGKPIPIVESYKYLGIEVNGLLDWKEVYEIKSKKLLSKLELIDGLAVNFMTKIQLVQWMVIPIITYTLPIVEMQKKWLEEWDREVRRFIRKWARRRGLATDMIHLSREYEGLGVPSLV